MESQRKFLKDIIMMGNEEVWSKTQIEHFLKNRALLKTNYENVFLHVQMVAKVARVIGTLIHLPEQEINILEKAALLHDADKRFSIRGKRLKFFRDRFDAEMKGHKWLEEKKKIPSILLEIIDSTKLQAAKKYLEGDFVGPEREKILSCLLFFADEIVDDSEIKHWQERIAAWTDPLLFEANQEYNGRSQKEVESSFATEVENIIRQIADISPEDDLIQIIRQKTTEITDSE